MIAQALGILLLLEGKAYDIFIQNSGGIIMIHIPSPQLANQIAVG